ncbi:MAG: hypothetical protein ISS70_26365 [Phycisphaerae bacterium]|nr:hypothetical protein [Phycisphaerae bacterium]
MRTSAIIHQQICQLRWHLLACAGLIMVLPIEEAVVGLWEGDGFHSIRMVYAVITFSPLLAGLIACANVQGDLSEKRYIFWRSKPANVKKLMALKFFVGLTLSLTIVACPLVFALVSTALCGEDLGWQTFKHYVPVPIVVAMMTYSLCFGCNVLVRNTARSWLIGLFLAGFALVIPLMLPLGFKDVVTDIGFRAFGFYPATIFVTSVAAFVFALYAAQHDWHLKTNLRELLWVGTGLVFLLLILFSSQVANIRVLDEKEVDGSRWAQGTLDKVGDRLIFEGLNYVDVGKRDISLHEIVSNGASVVNPPLYGNTGMNSQGHQVIYGPRAKGYITTSYPRRLNALYMDTEDGTYHFGIIAYFRLEGEGSRKEKVHEKVYLRSYKLVGNSWRVVDELNISDFIGDRVNYLRMAMRLIDNTLVACVNQSYVVADVTDPGDLRLIDKRLDALKGNWSLRHMDLQSEFDIPIIPVEGISIEERIKLSIDLRYRFSYFRNDIYKSSMVDTHNGKIAFFSVSEQGVAWFDVIRWDQKTAYCKFTSVRPFTILEGMIWAASSLHDRTFVENGKLYLSRQNTLLVFDVRVSRGIRKLGHFVRMDWNIEDIAVLDDGNMLLSAQWLDYMGAGHFEVRKRYLCLLKNPK